MSTDRLVQPHSTVVRDNDILFSNMDGETMMMSIERGEYYSLNPIGSRIWGLLETPRTVAEICTSLAPDYDISPEQCVQDVLLFVGQLVEKGVIKIVPV